MAPLKTDLLIAGGGLAGTLIALAVTARRPDIAITLVERGERLGGNHIWSFFDADLDAAGRALVAPLICYRWEGYDVAFPAFRRTLGGAYNSIESERLNAVARGALAPAQILLGRTIARLDTHGAILTDGARIEAKGVIDARGFGDGHALELGWQKFMGRLLRLEQPHGLTRPLIMDATVDQGEGYRFVYLLPFGPEHIFVEDTYYTPEPDLDRERISARIEAYARARGWAIAAVEREEAAALPIAIGGDFARLWQQGGADLPKAGMAAGLFHPMTGYSLPDAVCTAELVAGLPDLSSRALAAALHAHAAKTWRARGFYRLLARMLFRAAPSPDTRYRTFQHFYRLQEDLIARFYAARSTPLDRARILIGKPPVPVGRALKVLAGLR